MVDFTHDVMEEYRVMVEHGEYSNMYILEEEYHKVPLWKRHTVMEGEDEHILVGPTNIGGYASTCLMD